MSANMHQWSQFFHFSPVPVDVMKDVNMLYVFVDIKIDTAHFIDTIRYNFATGSKLAFVSTIQFLTALQVRKIWIKRRFICMSRNWRSRYNHVYFHTKWNPNFDNSREGRDLRRNRTAKMRKRERNQERRNQMTKDHHGNIAQKRMIPGSQRKTVRRKRFFFHNFFYLDMIKQTDSFSSKREQKLDHLSAAFQFKVFCILPSTFLLKYFKHDILYLQLSKVRKMLTDVLLTVTNEEIKAVARETLDARKGSSLL